MKQKCVSSINFIWILIGKLLILKQLSLIALFDFHTRGRNFFRIVAIWHCLEMFENTQNPLMFIEDPRSSIEIFSKVAQSNNKIWNIVTITHLVTRSSQKYFCSEDSNKWVGWPFLTYKSREVLNLFIIFNSILCSIELGMEEFLNQQMKISYWLQLTNHRP